MIKIGEEIKLVSAASKKIQFLKIIGKSFECYQYFPGINHINSNPNHNFLSNLQAEMPYFKIEKDPNDHNNCSQRIVSFVVSQIGYDESFVENSSRYNDSLNLFIFPYPVVKQIKEFKKKVHDYDYKITKTGHGFETRYKVGILEPVKIDEDTLKLINGTVEDISIKDVLINNKKVYITQKFTPFNRFEIMDI